MIKAFLPEKDREVLVEAFSASPDSATARITYVECRAALARARREGRLDTRGEASAVRDLDERWPHLQVVELDESLSRGAGDLARDLPIRAADAIQLASAELIRHVSGEDFLFACWDRRLWGAARSRGFEMLPAYEP